MLLLSFCFFDLGFWISCFMHELFYPGCWKSWFLFVPSLKKCTCLNLVLVQAKCWKSHVLYCHTSDVFIPVSPSLVSGSGICSLITVDGMLDVTERPGECPSSGEVGITIHECDNDMECEHPQKCCPVGGGAGQMCRNPVYSEFIEMYCVCGLCVCVWVCAHVCVCVCLCECVLFKCIFVKVIYSFL